MERSSGWGVIYLWGFGVRAQEGHSSTARSTVEEVTPSIVPVGPVLYGLIVNVNELKSRRQVSD